MATNAPITGAPAGASSLQVDLSRFLADNPAIAPSRLGRDALRDPGFVTDVLVRGRAPRLRVEQRVRRYIAGMGGC